MTVCHWIVKDFPSFFNIICYCFARSLLHGYVFIDLKMLWDAPSWTTTTVRVSTLNWRWAFFAPWIMNFFSWGFCSTLWRFPAKCFSPIPSNLAGYSRHFLFRANSPRQMEERVCMFTYIESNFNHIQENIIAIWSVRLAWKLKGLFQKKKKLFRLHSSSLSVFELFIWANPKSCSSCDFCCIPICIGPCTKQRLCRSCKLLVYSRWCHLQSEEKNVIYNLFGLVERTWSVESVRQGLKQSFLVVTREIWTRLLLLRAKALWVLVVEGPNSPQLIWESSGVDHR